MAMLMVSAVESAPSSGMRGGQYCEILCGSHSAGILTVSWNGTGGVCPMSPGFDNVTEQDVRAVHGQDAAIIAWNGIRQWTLDGFMMQQQRAQAPESSSGTFYTYGSMFPDGSGLVVRKQATLPIANIIGGATSYSPNLVTRSATAIWKANTKVYELVAPDCSQIYTMQSLMIGLPGDWYVEGGEAALSTLAGIGKISPPEGWIYQERTLDEDLYIMGSDGTTSVLQDDFHILLMIYLLIPQFAQTVMMERRRIDHGPSFTLVLWVLLGFLL